MVTTKKAQKTLFTAIKVGAFNLKHRIVLPALSRLRAQWPSANPSDLMHDYYSQRASNGGLLIAEATAITPKDVRIMRRLASILRSTSCVGSRSRMPCTRRAA